MRPVKVWIALLVAAVVPGLLSSPALGHPKNELNRKHPARTGATNGNFRRAAVIASAGAGPYATIRPLARALAFAHADRRAILDRVLEYRLKRGEEIALVELTNRTGGVKVVAIPHDRSIAPRVMSNDEVRALGIVPQDDAIPGMAARLRSRQHGTMPAESIRRRSLSTSGLSYAAGGSKPAQGLTPPRPGWTPVIEADMTVPITARPDNLRGSSIYSGVGYERLPAPPAE